MNNIFLFIIIVVIIICLLKAPEIISKYNPSQSEIQNLDYIDKNKFLKDYPYPQISNSFKKLSRGELPKPLNNINKILPNGTNNTNIIRTNYNNDNRVYLPEYFRKDRLNGNNINTEEYRPFINDKSDSETSWTDDNVSDNPKFYTSNFNDELTNIGSFFDKNNQYHDKTSSNTESLTTDNCYISKNGEKYCQDNTRLQLIPPKLISDSDKCTAFDSIGQYKTAEIKNKLNNKINNGSYFFNNVIGNSNMNNYSETIKDESGECLFK
tara:strand:- start:371 stop:1171 length:801 start_codon:yes stop_codon:yes gene_type:complete